MSDEQLTLPIRLPDNRQTFYPWEVMELLNVSDETLRQHAQDGTLVAINIARKGLRPVYRYTRESVEDFVRARNTRDNPDQGPEKMSGHHEFIQRTRKPVLPSRGRAVKIDQHGIVRHPRGIDALFFNGRTPGADQPGAADHLKLS